MENDSVIISDDITTTQSPSIPTSTSTILLELTTKILTTTTTVTQSPVFRNATENGAKIISSLMFSYFDYSIFAIMLILSVLIGVYFGFFAKQKQDNTAEYLLGGKKMSTIPVSASLIASHISGITLLGVPAEMYAHGTQYWVHIISAFIVVLTMAYIYLPVFYDLQLTSCFSYLEKRFDRSVRLTASFIYAISCVIFIPIVIYVPALAFNQVTGINIHLISPVICVVCIFYTTIGGLKAVVWTDTLQFILMIGASLAVIILGTMSVGSVGDVFKIADRGERIIFFK